MTTIELVSPHCLKVSGDLGFADVVAIKEQGVNLLDKTESNVEISLAGVTRAGSAAPAASMWSPSTATRKIPGSTGSATRSPSTS